MKCLVSVGMTKPKLSTRNVDAMIYSTNSISPAGNGTRVCKPPKTMIAFTSATRITHKPSIKNISARSFRPQPLVLHSYTRAVVHDTDCTWITISFQTQAAIDLFEKSHTHGFEVPRVLLEQPDALEAYIKPSANKTLLKWWAQYQESAYVHTITLIARSTIHYTQSPQSRHHIHAPSASST